MHVITIAGFATHNSGFNKISKVSLLSQNAQHARSTSPEREHQDGSMSDTSVHVGTHVKVAETAVVIQTVVVVARELEEGLLVIGICLVLD